MIVATSRARRRILNEIVDTVIGPACALFAFEVLMESARLESSDIYFLSRDATVFKEVADAMADAVPGLNPCQTERRVLSASRASGMVMGVADPTASSLIELTEAATRCPFSFARLFELLSLNRFDLEGIDERSRVAICDQRDGGTAPSFREMFERNEDVRGLLAELTVTRQECLSAYLEQEGVFDARFPLLVDIGYSGTWATVLSRVVERRGSDGGANGITFVFFATNQGFASRDTALHPSIDMRPGLVLDHRRPDSRFAMLTTAWLEPFLVDPDRGSLLGFFAGEGPGGTVAPVEQPSPLSEGHRSVARELRARIVAQAPGHARFLQRHADNLSTIAESIRRRLVCFAASPRHREAAAVALLAHQGGMGADAREICPRIGLSHPRWAVADLRREDRWVQGAIARHHLGILNRLLARRLGLEATPSRSLAWGR